MSHSASVRSNKLAGILMGLAALLSFGVMLNHPTNATGQGGLAEMVHGLLMFLTMVITAGFVRLAQQLGLNRFAVILALVVYLVGIVAVLIAANINGFVVPALINSGVYSKGIAALCWQLNQSLAYGSAIATSIAYILWGSQLVNIPEISDRWLGITGILIGIASAAAIFTGVIGFDVFGATVIYAGQWIFSVGTGLWLYKSASRE